MCCENGQAYPNFSTNILVNFSIKFVVKTHKKFCYQKPYNSTKGLFKCLKTKQLQVLKCHRISWQNYCSCFATQHFRATSSKRLFAKDLSSPSPAHQQAKLRLSWPHGAGPLSSWKFALELPMHNWSVDKTMWQVKSKACKFSINSLKLVVPNLPQKNPKRLK